MNSLYQENKAKVSDSIQPVISALRLDSIGEIIPIEHLSSSSVAFDWLDKYCGIDWIMKTNKPEHVLGIAARIQLTEPHYYDDPHSTFTIRYEMVSGKKTEYEKRVESIKEGYFYPYFTLQAYMKKENPGEVISAAVMRTRDLYEFIRIHPYLVKTNQADNVFKIVKWDDVKMAGYDILRVFNI